MALESGKSVQIHSRSLQLTRKQSLTSVAAYCNILQSIAISDENNKLLARPIGYAQKSFREKRILPRLNASNESINGNMTDDSKIKLEDLFSDIKVLTTTGELKSILSLWEQRRVVIAWARHFGCLLCKKRAAELASRKDDLRKAGVELVIIGPGTPEQAAAFKEITAFPGEVYADPTFETFKKLGFVHGAGTIFTLSALGNLVSARTEGFTMDWGLSLQKDTVVKGAWHQGGVLVSGPGVNRIVFLHKDKEAGDEPNWDEVVSLALQN